MNESAQIEMKEAMEILGITQPTFYRWLREGKIQGTKLGRRWRFLKSDVEALLRGESVGGAAPSGTEEAVNNLRAQIENVGADAGERTDDAVNDFVIASIHLAIALDATDLHLEPQHKIGRMRFRVDGVLQEVIELPNDVIDACVQNWKGKAHCNVQIKDLPQDGRINLEIGDKKQKIIIRITTVPTTLGETITVKFMIEEKVSIDINRIDFHEEHRKRIDRALAAPTGLIFSTGPTGSGKTTTLYCLLNELAKPEDKLMSVEDPVEYIIPGVNQVAVKRDGMTFAHAIRACLRSDPDVLMVGEMRDAETVEMVHHAALQGILVLSTLHTADAVGAIIRLRDIGISPHLIVEALSLVVSQNLVRRLCPHCAKKVKLDDATREQIHTAAAMGGIDPADLEGNWHEPVGCEKCNDLGYRGRTVINETLEVSDEVRTAIIKEADEEQLQQAARASGFSSLAADAIRKAAAGQTSLQELRRVCGI